MLNNQPIRKTNRRSRGASPRSHLLDVRLRTSTVRRQRHQFISKWVFNIVLLVSLGAASFFGIRIALDRFFFSNAEYTLNRINLNLDNILTRDELTAETGLHEGVNIFSVDLARLEKVLKAIPQVQTVKIERELPDQISVTLEARDPVAWVAAVGDTGDVTASEKSLLVDDTGFLMRPRHIQPEYFHLPVIYGVKSDNIQVGEPLSNEDLHTALSLIDMVGRHPESLLHIRTLDISRGYCIDVVNDRNAHLIFGVEDFEAQLARAQQLLANCEETGRNLESVNLMVKRNTPVKFVVASVPEVTAKSLPGSASNQKTRRN
jgi:cell division protein FtsQ